MKMSFIVTSCLLAIMALSSSSSVMAHSSDQTSKLDAAAKYKQASSEAERLQLCIEAINKGLVHLDMPVADIDELFGTAYRTKLPPKGQPPETGTVDFIPFKPSPSDDEAAAHEGWYLAFTFDDTGSVKSYYLTNLHKW